MVQNYEQIPQDPPDYDDFTISDEETGGSHSQNRLNDEENLVFEEFDIEDVNEPTDGRFPILRKLRAQAGASSRRLASNLNDKIVYPMTKIMDPVYELYKNSNIIFDSYLARIGNPLILKRLIYVCMITTLIYIITASGIYPNQNETLYGDFYNPEKLNSFIETHINTESMTSTLKYLSSMPHIAGTAGDLTLARFFQENMHNNGLSAVEFFEIDSFVNYPNISSLELLDNEGKITYSAKLSESTEDLNQNLLEFLAFNPISKSGEATAELVYANYGTPDDFRFLVDNQVNIGGKIVLMKYGKIPPSQKIPIATTYGARGVLFISDPEDGGYNMDTIQCDGVGIYKEFPGDVLSPLSLPNSNKISWSESPSTPKIISLPISWKSSLPLFESLQGKGVRKSDWDFTLDNKKIEIWTGHTSNKVHMVNKPLERDTKVVWDVVGRITGREQYDKGIIIGALRDSSCFGAVNPNTGSTVLLELIRMFAKLQSTYNWYPLRSIYFVSFDATNYNLAGATEWAQRRSRELQKGAYTYIDLSDAVSGDLLDIHAHPMLSKVIMSLLSEVREPINNETLLDSQFNRRHMTLEPIKEYGKNLLPFQTHLNIPSMEIKFTGKDYPKDSCADTFDNFEKNQIDKDMQNHKMLVELLAKIIVKLVEEPLIPFDVLSYVKSLDHYLRDLVKYAESIQGYKDNELNTAPFFRALLSLKNIGNEYEGWIRLWKEIVSSDSDQEPSLLTVNRWTWNLKLTLFEKEMIDRGILGRPWYKNVIFGPQYWQPEDADKYEWTTFPGVRDALRKKNWKLANEQLNSASVLLGNAVASFIS